jgi:hypothetical protein
MTNTKHTPGNWFTCFNAQGDMRQYIRSDESDLAICKVLDPIEVWNPGRMEANAALIAAAPEMLDALESIVDALNPIEKDMTESQIFKALSIAINAIKKAKGN